MDLIGAKILVLILFFVLTLLAAFLPWIMKVLAGGDNPESRLRVKQLLSTLNYASGGVFIATILLHLIPEVHHDMLEALEAYGASTDYPLPELVIGIGLLVFVLIEQVVLLCLGKRKDEDGETQELTENAEDRKESVDHTHEADLLQATSMIRSYALLIALSLHSIFEGIVVGLQLESSLVWELFVAIVIHKVLVAFGLGSRLLSFRHRISVVHFVGMVLVFSSMTPAGGVIGTIMSATPNVTPGMAVVQSVLVGLSTGSFMFVTFFEIIRFDGGHGANFLMCLLVVFGFACMASVMVLHPHHEGHDHPGNFSTSV